MLQQLFPQMSDAERFTFARRWNEYLIQKITRDEFLPTLLDPQAVAEINAETETGQPKIINSFATAFYRVGHTMLSPSLLLRFRNGETVSRKLEECFFAPEVIDNAQANFRGEDPVSVLLAGAASQNMQQIDTKLVDAVRNRLFQPIPDKAAFDQMMKRQDIGMLGLFGVTPEDVQEMQGKAALRGAARHGARLGGVEYRSRSGSRPSKL